MSNPNPRRKRPEDLRSHRWLGPDDLRSFTHRSRMKQMGYSAAEYEGKPVIAILNTWNDLHQCHTHFRERVEEIKRGVLQAGGFPVEVPVISLSETFMKPSAMFYRNLLAMEVEEVLRSHPIDGAVLLGGCDKTTPGLIMGATSHEPARHLRARRADAQGELARHDARQRNGCLEVLGRALRRQPRRVRTGGRSRTASPARPATA